MKKTLTGISLLTSLALSGFTNLTYSEPYYNLSCRVQGPGQAYCQWQADPEDVEDNPEHVYVSIDVTCRKITKHKNKHNHKTDTDTSNSTYHETSKSVLTKGFSTYLYANCNSGDKITHTQTNIETNNIW